MIDNQVENFEETFIKSVGQSMITFNDNVSKYIESLEEKGYRTEIQFINDIGEICTTEQEKKESIKCIVKAQKIKGEGFASRLWRKINNESQLQFQENVADYAIARQEAGFIIKLKWLNQNGEPCVTDEEKSSSTICEVLEREKTLEERLEEQRVIINNTIEEFRINR